MSSILKQDREPWFITREEHKRKVADAVAAERERILAEVERLQLFVVEGDWRGALVSQSSIIAIIKEKNDA